MLMTKAELEYQQALRRANAAKEMFETWLARDALLCNTEVMVENTLPNFMTMAKDLLAETDAAETVRLEERHSNAAEEE